MILLRFSPVFKLTVRKLSTDFIISSRAKQVQIPKVTLHEYLWKDLDKWSNNTAAICFETNRSYTYYELYKRSLSITRFLNKELKYRKQDTVGIVLQNVPEYPIVLLGAIQAGLKVTTINPNYTPDEIRKQLVDSESKLVFTSRDLLPLVRQATDIPIIEISNDESISNGAISFEEISTGEIQNPISDVSFEDTIILPYSSGTTGLPKGVQLSNFNLVANLVQTVAPEFGLIRKTEKGDQDSIPGFLPFFHIYGMVSVLLQSLVQGAKMITMPKFSSDNFIKLLKNYKTDVIYGVPLVVTLANNNSTITKEDLSGIRTLMSGAAPLGALDVERFRAKTNNKVNIIQGYGMTETSPVTLMQTDILPSGNKIGGSGLLLPNTHARMIPTDSDSSPLPNLPPHQVGELVIKGPQVMQGYFKNPQATKDMFLEEGWLRTGDIGYYDEDEHFFIIDRCKELIKVKGFQVAPAEIEEILRSHPGVADAGVVGVPHEKFGEAPKAFVALKGGRKVEERELQEYVAGKVAKHKHLVGGVTVVEAIPKSASGKILRRELKKM